MFDMQPTNHRGTKTNLILTFDVRMRRPGTAIAMVLGLTLIAGGWVAENVM